MFGERADRDFYKIESHNLDILKRFSSRVGVRKSSKLSITGKTDEFSTQTLGEDGELSHPIDIDDTMVVKDNCQRLVEQWESHYVEEILHDLILRKSIHEKVSHEACLDLVLVSGQPQ